MDEGSKNYTDMIAAMPKGADSIEVQAHRRTLAKAHGLLLDPEARATA